MVGLRQAHDGPTFYLPARVTSVGAADTVLRGSNLHALWDVGLIKNLEMSTEALTTRLLAKPVASGAFNAVSVAEESCRIVGTPGFYPDRKVDALYVERFTPVMEGRLVAAGARLAGY